MMVIDMVIGGIIGFAVGYALRSRQITKLRLRLASRSFVEDIGWEAIARGDATKVGASSCASKPKEARPDNGTAG